MYEEGSSASIASDSLLAGAARGTPSRLHKAWRHRHRHTNALHNLSSQGLELSRYDKIYIWQLPAGSSLY